LGAARWGSKVGVIAVVFAVAPGIRPVSAHERSESFSHWSFAHGELNGVVTVRSREATRLTLPGEGVGALTPILAAHLDKTIAASMDGAPCAATRHPRPLASDAGYIRIGIEFRCPEGERLHIGIGTFFDVAPAHHHFIYVESQSGASREAILTASSHMLELDLTAMNNEAAGFRQFVQMGIVHIATGIDHLAFLLALLITARNVRQALIIVTGFTLGHSLTLSLAVLGVVQADRGAVESLIGLTIALAAARNLIRGEREGRIAAWGAALVIASMLLVPSAYRPDMPGMLIVSIALGAACAVWRGSMRSDEESVRARLMMATGFGLIHGLGFAGALQDLHLPRHMLVYSLVGFNIGVEIGQLAAVAAAALLARAMMQFRPAPPATGMPAVVVSAILLAVGTAWFLTRAVTLTPM
jgi:HupE / UreJ protein